VEQNRKAGQNPPRVVAPTEEEEEVFPRRFAHGLLLASKNNHDFSRKQRVSG